MSFVAAGVAVVGGAIKLFGGMAKAKKAKKEQAAAKKEMAKKKKIYEALDTSNPYANLKNSMANATINQKEAALAQQGAQQSQANQLQGMRTAAGGSGIAALAQSMANAGTLSAQKNAALIGTQEAANQKAFQDEASKNQGLKASGAQKSQEMERDKQATLLAMAGGQVGAANQSAADAKKQQMDAVGGMVQGAGNIAGGMMQK